MAVPPQMLKRALRFQICIIAVKAAAAIGVIISLGLDFIGRVRELKAKTVIATGGAVFSTKARKPLRILPVFSRKNKNGKILQKKITTAITKHSIKASLTLVLITSLIIDLPLPLLFVLPPVKAPLPQAMKRARGAVTRTVPRETPK